jgi:hypothetical protein
MNSGSASWSHAAAEKTAERLNPFCDNERGVRSSIRRRVESVSLAKLGVAQREWRTPSTMQVLSLKFYAWIWIPTMLTRSEFEA